MFKIISPKTSHSAVTTLDLSKFLDISSVDEDDLTRFFQENPMFAKTDRLFPQQYSSKDTLIQFGVPRFQSTSSQDVHFYVGRAVQTIMNLRPENSGGKRIKLSIGDCFPDLSTIFDLIGLSSAEDRQKISQSKFLDGKIYKTHSSDQYWSDLVLLLNIILLRLSVPKSKKIIFCHSGYDGRLFGSRAVDSLSIWNLLDGLGEGGFVLLPLVPLSRRRILESDHGIFESGLVRKEFERAWSDHFERPVDVVVDAANRWLALNRQKSAYWTRYGSSEAYLSAIEGLNSDLIDSLTIEGSKKSTNDVAVREHPLQRKSAYQYKLSATGLQQCDPDVDPKTSDLDLGAKYKAARAAFKEFEQDIRGLENTHYRDFSRFVAPLAEAIGDSLSTCDPIMIVSLSRPFARLLIAARLDEERERERAAAEFDPISEIRREHLNWLSEAIQELAEALQLQSEMDAERKSLSISETDLSALSSDVKAYLRSIRSVAEPFVTKLETYLKLNEYSTERRAEIAHVVLVSLANLTTAVFEPLFYSSRGEALKLNSKSPSPGASSSEDGWSAFKKRIGSNLADLMAAKLTAAQMTVIGTVYLAFTSHGSALAAQVPQLFEGIMRLLGLI